MVELLKERGIVAERKSVYDDIQTLNEMPDTPFEIVQQRGAGAGIIWWIPRLNWRS